MEIKQNFDYVTGTFDTDTDKLICIKHEKYLDVSLCVKSNMHIPFAKIKLYSGSTFSKAKPVFNDAYSLGQEICKRWNTGPMTDNSAITKEYILSLPKYSQVMPNFFRRKASKFLNIRVEFASDGTPKLSLETPDSGFQDTLCQKSLPTVADLNALERMFGL